MTEKDFTFNSSDGVSVIHGHAWVPEKKPVALLQILHGMQEYIERYSEFAGYLCKKGFVVVGHDHIFHGHSASSPEKRGISPTKIPDVVMSEDAFRLYRRLEEKYGDIPRFILGHSMGSYILRRTLCEKAKQMSRLSGAIILGTGSENQAKLAAGKVILAAVTLIKGRDSYSKLIKDLSFGKPYRKFDQTGMHPEDSWLSRNVESVKAFENDPLCNFQFSLGAMKTLVYATYYDNKLSNIKKMKSDLPILFASGTEDPVGNLGKGVTEAYHKFVKAGLNNVSLRFYEGDRHEILNEIDRDKVYDDLFDWMMEIIAAYVDGRL